MAPTFRRSQWIIPILSTLLVIFSPERSGAQPVVPAQDGTGTVVTPDGNQFDVTGGQLSADNANLFHNFERLGLSEGQVLNFISSPEIVNILGRVTGGEASFIDGLVQITGGNSNLFLINPAGILFGQNASLNIPGSLTLTTATGIGFESDVGIQFLQGDNWSELVGTPNRFVFDADNPGSIANFGDLSVSPGAEITVLAGSVLNAGKLDAPEGRVTIAALPDAEMIRISQEGNLLNLEVLPAPGIDLQQTGLSPLSLPELLTGAGDIVPATKVEVTGTGEITLVGSDATVSEQQGTATMTEDVNTDSLEVHGQNILLDESLALSPNTRLILQAPEGEVTLSQLGEPDAELSEILVTAETATLSGDLFSDEAIDLSEVNQLDLVGESITLDTSSGDGPINLASNTNGAGDLTLDSGLGRATFGTIGDVESPNSLRVSGNEASGNGAIIAGSGGITIDSTEEVNLEASLSTEGTVALSSTEGNVLTNDITATDIDLSAQQDLNTGNLFTSSDTAAGGAITLEAVEGEIITGQIDSFGVDGGAITLQANTRIQTREIDSSGTPGNAGNVTLEALGDIEASLIRAEGGAEGQGGNVFIDSSEGLVRVTSAFPTSFSETGLASISTGGELGGGSIIIRHAGEQLGETFAVGETTLNGTSDAITSGDSEIPLPSTFSESITEGNITIEASNPGVSSPPDNPEEPDNPGFPEIPELPEEPEEPDNPDDPEPPEFPEEPDEFENPDDPEPPEFLEEPDDFENPDEIWNPEFPEEPDEFENPDEFEPPEFAGEFDEFPDGFEPPGFPRETCEFPDGFEPPGLPRAEDQYTEVI
ncbi:MAG: filamentous hemagglutinin N-terminal domain-containing protein [Microcoleaceae cyanobacterium]